MIDLVRLRVKPLENYQYPAWQTTIFVVLYGLIGGAEASGLGGNLLGRIGLYVVFSWLHLKLVARFMVFWLGLFKRKLTYPLFGLLVACNGIGILSPLTSWLPEDVGLAATIALAFIGLLVTVNAIAKVGGVTRIKVFLGALVAGMLVVLLFMVEVLIEVGLGWISLPR